MEPIIITEIKNGLVLQVDWYIIYHKKSLDAGLGQKQGCRLICVVVDKVLG